MQSDGNEVSGVYSNASWAEECEALMAVNERLENPAESVYQTHPVGTEPDLRGRTVISNVVEENDENSLYGPDYEIEPADLYDLKSSCVPDEEVSVS